MSDEEAIKMFYERLGAKVLAVQLKDGIYNVQIQLPKAIDFILTEINLDQLLVENTDESR